MIVFKAILLKFDSQGEKTGWTYFSIPKKIALLLKPGNKKSFRVQGKIDNHTIKSVSLLPMGEGNFIMPVNATMRKEIRKKKGDTVEVALEVDTAVLKISSSLLACMEDEPGALSYFNKLPPSHQQYYSKWIESAKTEVTKTKRIAIAVNAFSKKLGFSEMMQMQKREF